MCNIARCVGVHVCVGLGWGGGLRRFAICSSTNGACVRACVRAVPWRLETSGA